MSASLTPSNSRAAWKGSEIDYRTVGMHVLTENEIAEIDAALDHLRSLGDVDFAAITQAEFPLSVCRPFLERAADELRDGVGFLLLRGLPRVRYSEDDMARIYFGLGTYLGTAVAQSYLGELLGNVLDVSDIVAHTRGYRSGGGQRMHTDSADIVSLMCLRAARSGGGSRIVSALAVHDELLRRRPDLLQLLYDGYVFRRMELDAQYGDGVVVRRVSIFERHGDTVSCYVSGAYPRRAVEAGDAVMSAAQQDALDEFERIASSPEFTLDMSIGEGDIQFLNNRVILHGRTDYEDWPEVARRRHMLRLWLRAPSWPGLPETYGAHKAADFAGWLRQRQPFQELPSRYLDEMTTKRREQAA
jgi:Taurine catabolism dioxygenase TauD, TfdA family